MIPAWSILADKLKRLAVKLDENHQPQQAEYTRSAELTLRRTRKSLGSAHPMESTIAYQKAEQVLRAYSPVVTPAAK